MAGKRQPTELVVLNGRKHLTKAEIEQRKNSEPKAPAPKQIRIPKYLPESLCRKFRDLAKQLIEIGIFTTLDFDCLARYLLAEQAYLALTDQVNKAIANKAFAAVGDLSKVQARYFSQCSSAANDLGLTISSRCRLVVPQAPKEDEDAMSKMLRERAEGRRKA